jgi:hypothetical protein
VTTVSSISTPTTILTYLAEASQNATQLTTQVEADQATSQIERQLQQKIAALPNQADNTLLKVLQGQLTQVNNQLKTLTNLSQQFGTNGNILTDINKELDALHTAAANGDSANFDQALSVINTDIGNLVVVSSTSTFQPDQILSLKTNGIGIQGSASYDLSTSAGRDAANAAINAAQALVNQSLSITTNNQLVAGSLSTALSSQLDSMTKTAQQTKTASDTAVATQTAQLTQLAQNQEHLIQLALGNTTQLSSALAKMATVSDPPSSPFGVLSDAVGATADSITPGQVSSAILSLLV